MGRGTSLLVASDFRQLLEPATVAGQLSRRDKLLRYACLLLMAAIGMRTLYAGLFEAKQFGIGPHWALEWSAGYLCFLVSYLISCRNDVARRQAMLIGLLATQAAAALFLVWLYPSFTVTCLMVVVAWQLGWTAPLRVALAIALLLAIALALMKCAGEAEGLSFLILAIACGFQMFAISAAHLARSEALAHDELSRVNAELRAAQALMTENARMTERLRIARDLHDVLGHSLTTLKIHLDVASRLAQGQAAEHVQCARDVSGALLTQVRAVVNRVRVAPVDLRASLLALTEGAVGLKVRLLLPENLSALDPARADAVVRCVQEVLTNTLRHAQAQELVIGLEEAPDGSIAISTRDDGRGGRFVEGGGLTGMRERFELLGGNLSIMSPPGGGFCVRGVMPAAGVSA
jgi:signal transduction histidine kinase